MAAVKGPCLLSTNLFSVDSVYQIAFSWLLGQSIWQSFFGGIIAHKALTRQAFSVLQAKTFPVYFMTSTGLSSILLALWSAANWEDMHGSYLSMKPVVFQAYTLLLIIVLSMVNWFVIGPKTNEIVIARQRLERAEGKPYYDRGASKSMKALNSQFSKWHGISSLANLIVIIALLYHGLWYGSYGVYNDFSRGLPSSEVPRTLFTEEGF